MLSNGYLVQQIAGIHGFVCTCLHLSIYLFPLELIRYSSGYQLSLDFSIHFCLFKGYCKFVGIWFVNIAACDGKCRRFLNQWMLNVSLSETRTISPSQALYSMNWNYCYLIVVGNMLFWYTCTNIYTNLLAVRVLCCILMRGTYLRFIWANKNTAPGLFVIGHLNKSCKRCYVICC